MPRSAARPLTAAFLFAALSACSGAPEATPSPSPVPSVVTSPALQPLVFGWFVQYSVEVGVPAFDIEVLGPEAALAATESGEMAAALLAVDPPDGWFATPLGREDIAIVVNPGNRVQRLDLASLGDIFSGRTQSWVELGGSQERTQPVIPIRGDEIRERFASAALRGAFYTPNALLGPSPSAVIELVSEEIGGIGMVPEAQIDSDSTLIRVEGLLPGDRGYPLWLEIVATAPEEPQGAIRAWLVWLQALSGDSFPSP